MPQQPMKSICLRASVDWRRRRERLRATIRPKPEQAQSDYSSRCCESGVNDLPMAGQSYPETTDRNCKPREQKEGAVQKECQGAPGACKIQSRLGCEHFRRESRCTFRPQAPRAHRSRQHSAGQEDKICNESRQQRDGGIEPPVVQSLANGRRQPSHSQSVNSLAKND
jgi:hypothetical protein